MTSPLRLAAALCALTALPSRAVQEPARSSPSGAIDRTVGATDPQVFERRADPGSPDRGRPAPGRSRKRWVSYAPETPRPPASPPPAPARSGGSWCGSWCDADSWRSWSASLFERSEEAGARGEAGGSGWDSFDQMMSWLAGAGSALVGESLDGENYAALHRALFTPEGRERLPGQTADGVWGFAQGVAGMIAEDATLFFDNCVWDVDGEAARSGWLQAQFSPAPASGYTKAQCAKGAALFGSDLFLAGAAVRTIARTGGKSAAKAAARKDAVAAIDRRLSERLAEWERASRAARPMDEAMIRQILDQNRIVIIFIQERRPTGAALAQAQRQLLRSEAVIVREMNKALLAPGFSAFNPYLEHALADLLAHGRPFRFVPGPRLRAALDRALFQRRMEAYFQSALARAAAAERTRRLSEALAVVTAARAAAQGAEDPAEPDLRVETEDP